MPGFRDVIGHEQIIHHLKNAVSRDKVSHAYIFNGPERSGKMMLAETFAMLLQCESDTRITRQEPCMECHSCRQALGKNQPDIIYLQHEKPNTISVNDIREQINNDIGVKPYSSRYKVYIVDEAEKMNVQAQNALLKTIEEPPAYAVILLLTTNADAFLQTILSRCVRLDLKAVEDDKIRRFLMKQCQVPDYQADVCTAFAQGNVGRAMSLVSSEHFNELKDYTLQLLRRMRDVPDYDVMTELKALGDFRENIQDFFDFVLIWYRDVLLYKASGNTQKLIFQDQVLDIRRQADRCSYAGLNAILEAINTASRRVKANVNFELTMELLMLTIKENIS